MKKPVNFSSIIQNQNTAEYDLYDGEAQEVAAETQGDGSGRGGCRAGDEP